jgi:metal-dependent amidase/aminoacylase/carboxypeptidase family protein
MWILIWRRVKIAVAPGPYTLASDVFDVIIYGRSAHAARASEGVDAIAIAATTVTELQKLVHRFLESARIDGIPSA